MAMCCQLPALLDVDRSLQREFQQLCRSGGISPSDEVVAMMATHSGSCSAEVFDAGLVLGLL
jgi:hypothetical protein